MADAEREGDPPSPSAAASPLPRGDRMPPGEAAASTAAAAAAMQAASDVSGSSSADESYEPGPTAEDDDGSRSSRSGVSGGQDGPRAVSPPPFAEDDAEPRRIRTPHGPESEENAQTQRTEEGGHGSGLMYMCRVCLCSVCVCPDWLA